MPTAFFAGRFDPVTNGHLDIARRAADLFEKLV
ncbi:MAG TPA: adenylyltransferase/cytidyltransferase family protein, partial [Dehalococcoidia bacterium]|nr:adenylyltransferase/cytidyltransferase family protein [Dehalococcoidia bacterium]